jgi:hypothetical protein
MSTKDNLRAQIIRLHCNLQFHDTHPLQQAHCHLVERLTVRNLMFIGPCIVVITEE